jgi:hypothetical protein
MTNDLRANSGDGRGQPRPLVRRLYGTRTTCGNSAPTRCCAQFPERGFRACFREPPHQAHCVFLSMSSAVDYVGGTNTSTGVTSDPLVHYNTFTGSEKTCCPLQDERMWWHMAHGCCRGVTATTVCGGMLHRGAYVRSDSAVPRLFLFTTQIRALIARLLLLWVHLGLSSLCCALCRPLCLVRWKQGLKSGNRSVNHGWAGPFVAKSLVGGGGWGPRVLTDMCASAGPHCAGRGEPARGRRSCSRGVVSRGHGDGARQGRRRAARSDAHMDAYTPETLANVARQYSMDLGDGFLS